MASTIKIENMRPEDADALYQLVERVSNAMVCQDFEENGADEFFSAVSMMLYERPQNHIVLVAREGDRPVGLIDVRSGFHICLFFVDLDAQGQGIGRALFDAAVERCGLGERAFFEVNSSLFAVPIYEKLGFRKKSGVRLLNGIRFVEMVYDAEP